MNKRGENMKCFPNLVDYGISFVDHFMVLKFDGTYFRMQSSLVLCKIRENESYPHL
jgi:hypothetical protein